MITSRTAFQIFRSEDTTRTTTLFASLAKEIALPYKIRAAEESLLSALEIVESSQEERRIYGPSTLHAAASYLTHLVSFVPLASRAAHLEPLAVNYDALQRVASLYGVSPAARLSLAQLAAANATASRVPVAVISSVLDDVSGRERTLRQELRDAGEKGVMFRRRAEEKPEREDPTTEMTPTAGQKRWAHSNAPDEESPPVESAKDAVGGAESVEEAATAAPERKVAKLETPRAPKKVTKQLVVGRLRTLSNPEKKVATLFGQMVQLLAHVYAVKYNNLLPVFEILEEKVRLAQEIIDAERANTRVQSSPPTKPEGTVVKAETNERTVEPFLEVSLENVLRVIHDAAATYRTDEECRYELDEDLLHPIAHACMSEQNRIEGFTTRPFVGPDEKTLAAKAKLREVARAKREEQRSRIIERARAKEELAARREEERQLVRAQLGELDASNLVEDTSIKNPVPTAYVCYATLPLPTPEQYEQALFIWAMITSLPQPLRLSQMHFSLFLKGLKSDETRENGLMEEVVQSLLDVAIEDLRQSGTNSARIVTRGKTWFDAMVEFVAVTSGNKKKRQTPQRQKMVSSDEDDDDEDDDGDDDDYSGENTNDEDDMDNDVEEEEDEDEDEAEKEEEEEEEGKGDKKSKKIKTPETDATKTDAAKKEEENGKQKEEEEEAPDRLRAAVKIAMEHITELRQLATWGNIEMDDRLSLLEYLVSEVVGTAVAQEEAEQLHKHEEDAQLALEKRTRELREEAEREVRALGKQQVSSPTTASAPNKDHGNGNVNGSTNGEDSYEIQRQRLLDEATRRMHEAASGHLGVQDGNDKGALIRPLGMDRFRRIYWRFPLDRHLHVQTTAATDTDFPVLQEPREIITEARQLILDDDDDDDDIKKHSKRDGADTDVPQRMWGIVQVERLEQFMEGLDRRGMREAALRRSLEAIRPYLINLSEPQMGRVTRARAHTFGYFNKLKPEI